MVLVADPPDVLDRPREKKPRKPKGDRVRSTMLVFGEVWVQSANCTLCRKPVLFHGRCYVCATGRPRLLLRHDERNT